MIVLVNTKGGDCVLQETIKAVKDAENKAETILKEADEKVISLREQANQDAKTL